MRDPMHKHMHFQYEMRRNTMVSVQKCQPSLCDGGKPVSFIFAAEKRHEDFSFATKSVGEDLFSVQNPMARQQFHCRTEGPDAMASSETSQPRDFANPLGVEPLSL